MVEEFIGHLQTLAKVETLIARIWFGVLARRFALFALAGLIALFGLGMADLAGFYQLQAPLGNVWAAAVVALADFVVAAIIAAFARNARPGPEIELAIDVRKLAIESLQADVRELEAGASTITQQFRGAREMISGLVTNPLDAAALRLLIPLVLAIVRGLRARHDKSDQAGGK